MNTGEDGVVIPLHDAAAPQRRRSAVRRSARRPQPADGSAEVYAFNAGAEEPELPSLPVPAPMEGWERRAIERLGFVRRRLTGNYTLDDYGFDPDLAENIVLPIFRMLYDNWFRVEVNGVENIPEVGGALLVANHAGGLWALDAAMTAVAVRERHPARRRLRMLGDARVFATPGLSVLARRVGATLACSADAERLLMAGELVGTWPEGFDGIGKRFRDRYRLQRFGRGGFVGAAVAAGVPIIPVSIVGAEEIHPVLGHVPALARLLDLPYFPLTPTFPWLGPLGLLPLPSKWYIEFGTPIHTEDFGERGGQLFDLTDQVSETIQATLYRLLVQRRSTWR